MRSIKKSTKYILLQLLLERKKMKKLILISIAALTLSACGGGGSDSGDKTPPTPTPTPTPTPKVMPAGIWVGDITYTNGSVDDAYLLIAPDGETRFVDSDEQGKAKVTLVDHENYTATMKSFGTNYATGSMSGTYSKSRFKGEAFFGGTKASDYDFSKDSQSSNTASFATIKGNYVSVDYTASVAIDADGIISGSNTDGCQYNGQISIPDSTVNIYKVAFTASSCGSYNGEYSGLATYAYLHANSSRKALVYQADNGRLSFTEILIK